MSESLKEKTVKGTIWTGIERFWVQGVQFLVMLVVARILSPKDYGLIGMLAIFIHVSQSLVDSGFSQALIRKKNRTEIDHNTIFYFNIVMSLFFYVLLYSIAPLVASFYKQPVLCSVMRIFCLVVIIESFNIVQRSLYTIHLDFKKLARASMSSAIISGIAAIYMAKKGFGVWTLVYQQIIFGIVSTIVLWYYSSWRPKWIYSWKSFKEMFSFGFNLLISGLLDIIYKNLYTIVTGKVFNATSLGYYSRADHYAQLPASNFNSIFLRVTYPVLCKMQDDDVKLRENYRKLLRVSAFIIFPVMCGLAGAAYPSVVMVIGKKWSYAAVLLVPICLAKMWYPIHAINLNLLKVKGRSDLFLRLEIIKKILGTCIIFLSIPFGLFFMCYIQIVSSLIALSINTYYTGKLIHLGFWKQMKDISHILLTSLSMFAIIKVMNMGIDNIYLQFVLDIIVGVVFYCGVAFLFHFKEIDDIKSLRKEKQMAKQDIPSMTEDMF